MPVTIGAKPSPDFDNPIALLSDCHRRIEHFLAVLIRVVTEAAGKPISDEQSRALERSLEYFRNAAPRHTADEEESLFPRLRESNSPEVQSALLEVEKLEADHERAAKWHEEVDDLCNKWLSAHQLGQSDTERLRTALAGLDELYRHHIALEDNQLFPVAAAVLSSSDVTKIGSEMAQRRGLIRDAQR